jgi:hypothetical protein
VFERCYYLSNVIKYFFNKNVVTVILQLSVLKHFINGTLFIRMHVMNRKLMSVVLFGIKFLNVFNCQYTGAIFIVIYI